MRGYAAEFGGRAARGLDKIEPLLARIAQDETVPALARELLAIQGQDYAQLQIEVKAIEVKLMAWHRANACSRRLAQIPGEGPIGATALVMKTPIRARCPARIHLDVVARTPRDVLDLQGHHYRTAPLVRRVTADFREVVRVEKSANDGRRQTIVRRVHVMPRGRNLPQTPGLVDADVAYDVRSMAAAASGAVNTSRIDAIRQVEEKGTVEHNRVIQTKGGGHAVAELP